MSKCFSKLKSSVLTCRSFTSTGWYTNVAEDVLSKLTQRLQFTVTHCLYFSFSYLDLGLRVVLDQVLQLSAEHRGRHGVWEGGG